jgi:AbrB family looped-hinge helix DNA binding protein
MMATATVTMDKKGRVSIPLEVREALGMRPGAIVALALVLEEGEVRLKVVDDPYADYGPIARRVKAEFERGETKPLRQYMAERGIDPDQADDDENPPEA